MKSRIHFIRHGKTEGTEKRWYYGAADLPLVQEGIDATKVLKAEGIYPSGDDAQFFTSGLTRAEQTLQIIYGKVDHKQIHNLEEMNFGVYECKTYEDLKNDPTFEDWCYDDEGDVVAPEGESKNMFAARIRKGLDELIGYHKLKEFSHRHSGMDANTIMVCHGGVISACMLMLFPDPSKRMWDWCPDPGHGFTVLMENGEPVGWEKF